MPPKLNTTSPEAKLRPSAAVRRAASSPRYCAQASRSPRFVRAPMRKARCLSWRFPTRISSPMMKAPNAKSRCLFCPLLQILQAADMLAVDEDLRHRPARGNSADHARADPMVERHLGVVIAEVLQQHLALRAIIAAFARENRHLIWLLRLGIYVVQHGLCVRHLIGVAGLFRLDEHLLDRAVVHQHRIPP